MSITFEKYSSGSLEELQAEIGIEKRFDKGEIVLLYYRINKPREGGGSLRRI